MCSIFHKLQFLQRLNYFIQAINRTYISTIFLNIKKEDK